MDQQRLKTKQTDDKIGAESTHGTSKGEEKDGPPAEKRKRVDDVATTSTESPTAVAGKQKEKEENVPEKPPIGVLKKDSLSPAKQQQKITPQQQKIIPQQQQKITPQQQRIRKYADVLNEDPANNRDRLREFVLSIGNPGHRESLLQLGVMGDPKTFDEPLLLHRAASKGILQCVETLLNAGADINARNTDGKTPLHVAIEKNRIRVVNELIARGADLNATDKLNNDSLLHYCKSRNFSNRKKIKVLVFAKSLEIS